MTSRDRAPAESVIRSGQRGILAILLLSLGLKLGILFLVGDFGPYRDEGRYLEVGQSLAAGEGFAYSNRAWDDLHAPPLYPLFMGAVYYFGGGAFESKFIQVLLSTATVWFLFLLGRRWFGPRAGLWGAGIAAFYPTLIAFTHYNWNETFFLFWLCASCLALFDRSGALRSPRGLLGAGVLFGATALTRAEVVYLIPLLWLWMYAQDRDWSCALRRGGAFFGGVLLLIAPWTAYVYQTYGGFLLISSGSAGVWYHNYNVPPPNNTDLGMNGRREHPRLRAESETPRPRVLTGSPIERSRQETQNALRFITRHPGLCFRRFWVRMAQLVNPTSFLVRHVRLNYYMIEKENKRRRPRVPPGIQGPRLVQDAIVWTTVGAYLLVAILAVIGLSTMPQGKPRSLSLLVVLYFMAVYSLTYSCTRYRLSFVPFLAIAAGYVLANRAECRKRLAQPTVALWVLVLLSTLGYAWSMYFDHLWNY